MDLFNYTPRRTHPVRVGTRPMGGGQPLRLQSMTTRPTTDIEGCVAQARRIIDAGADLVRLTTQGTREALALQPIQRALRELGYDQPLVADVHFNPAVADVAATIVDGVRINPGNYVDPARTFRRVDYTDQEYAAELSRLEKRFGALLDICRQHHTALRIGVNHGSLSDRIMCRYGDTPEGIVESCMEFLRVCQRQHFPDVVVSIKASNTQVMVRSVRLLCQQMEREGMDYPLHLGVTEAGEGEDGRIKSAVGIGALLADGIGSTVRVSLSEEPECELPVAYKLCADIVGSRSGHNHIPALPAPEFCYEHPVRRPTLRVDRVGADCVPVVVSCQAAGVARRTGGDWPDYVYVGSQLSEATVEGIQPAESADGQEDRAPRLVADFPAALAWRQAHAGGAPCAAEVLPAFTSDTLMMMAAFPQSLPKFLFLSYPALTDEVKACLRHHPETVVVAQSAHANPTGELRALVHELWRERIAAPVVLSMQSPSAPSLEDWQLHCAGNLGALLFDGLCDGLMLWPSPAVSVQQADQTAFGILQAARLRTTRTEYISCPGCGRTLYDLPLTIRRIKQATAHLRGLKIGIMGCIVNGPGEMADADYGYVGAARGKVSLYRGRTCVEKNIPEDQAVERLLALIDADRARLCGSA